MFGRKNEKKEKINDLIKRFEELKQKASNPNASPDEITQYQKELAQINQEIEELQ